MTPSNTPNPVDKGKIYEKTYVFGVFGVLALGIGLYSYFYDYFLFFSSTVWLALGVGFIAGVIYSLRIAKML